MDQLTDRHWQQEQQEQQKQQEQEQQLQRQRRWAHPMTNRQWACCECDDGLGKNEKCPL